jgi:hypothetical protein
MQRQNAWLQMLTRAIQTDELQGPCLPACQLLPLLKSVQHLCMYLIGHATGRAVNLVQLEFGV